MTMDIYRALWRRRFLIALLTLATVATAWIVVSRETKMYRSTSLIRVQQRVSDPTQIGSAIGIAQHLAQTYAKIVATDAVADRVYRQLHGSVPRYEIRIKAEPVADLELLYVSATSSNPRWAARVANTAPRALLPIIDTQPKAERDQIEVVNPAGVSTSPVSPHVRLSLVIAFLAGLVFNSGIALLVELLSDRIRDVEELETLTERPVLATVPILDFRSTVAERVQERLALAREGPPGEARTLTQPAPRRSGG